MMTESLLNLDLPSTEKDLKNMVDKRGKKAFKAGVLIAIIRGSLMSISLYTGNEAVGGIGMLFVFGLIIFVLYFVSEGETFENLSSVTLRCADPV